MSATIETSAFQAGILKLLAAEIGEWSIEEVLNKTEELRKQLDLTCGQLQAAVCGANEVVVLIAGGVADRETVMAAKVPVDPDQLSARDLLTEAIQGVGKRTVESSSDNGGQGMADAVQAFNAITGCDLSEAEGWAFLLVNQLVASRQGGPFTAKTYSTMASLVGLAGEAEAKRHRRIEGFDEDVA
ncbi:hypothetical protein [Vreelandella alkaliphila]|uniref:Uncharacterized protein n=1 Tax=Vreelandella alkaliphila TaxID=272774 RepID=A0AAJ2VQI1_9GAMM|nr:hypothetical protein [Halomonas alkaliphila]MDX5979572.1 hypothetical protein [Halomonas alkaliphila]